MEIFGGSYRYIQLKYSFPDVNNKQSIAVVFLQILCIFVMWSVSPTRFKDGSLSSRSPLCNENLDILRQSPWPAHGGQPTAHGGPFWINFPYQVI